MQFDWDENKRHANIRNHAIDFQDAVTIFDGNIITIEDERFDYDEQRFISLGLMKGNVIVVVYIERGEITRIISARKATKYEQINYFKQITN
jgi:uncharacterized DUF497 family protein